MADRWTPENDQILMDIYEHSSKKDIMDRLGKDWMCICRRARRLNFHRDKILIDGDRKIRYKVRKDSYIPQEISLLKEIYETNTKEFIISAFEKAGFSRSWQSILLTARSIGLKRNPDIIMQEMIDAGKNAPTPSNIILWTEEENERLHPVYCNGSQEEIMALFPDRTFRAIRGQALKLGLSRSKEAIDKDRTKHLKENFGVDSTWQLKSVKDASRQTNLVKRGFEYPTQSADVRAKVLETVQIRYGVDNVFQAEEIQKKSRQSMYQDGTQRCSKQQRYIANLLKGEINYPVGNCNVDILLDDKIVCEYDGGGHYIGITLGVISEREFNDKERRRNHYLKERGFSLIRIISKEDLLPEDSIILKMIFEAKEYLKTGHSWVNFNIDKKTIEYKNFKIDYDYGKLRQIKN